MTVIATVLRSGGIYTPAHVQRLAAQAREVAPGEPFVCLSDVPVAGVMVRPMTRHWPGWWSKMELFAPDTFTAGARVLYADLDTTFVGRLDDILACGDRFLVLEDFYRHPPSVPVRGIGSGLMMWTAGDQAELYERFAGDPIGVMGRIGYGGDQRFIEREVATAVTFWQDVVPGQVVSYKVHCQAHGVPAGSRVVCWHGRPKPWDVPELTWQETACLAS